MRRKWTAAIFLSLSLCLAAARAEAEWTLLNWIEKPSAHGPSTKAPPEDRTEFVYLFSFDAAPGREASWAEARRNLREGDVIAYRMDAAEARKKIFLRAKLNLVGYRLLKYGHAAIVVKDPNDENKLRLLSSWSFRGPNVDEEMDSLSGHSWDAYRLDQWERVDKKRFYEFIGAVRRKAEKWYGYDFSGMFGLWNSNLRPATPEEIGRSYICSTVVVAALQYAGVKLDADQRFGVADIVTPLQLVASKGRIVALSESATAPALEQAAADAEKSAR